MKNFKQIAIAAALLVGSQLAIADGVYLIASVGPAIPASSVKSDLDSSFISAGYRGLSTSMSNGTSMRGGLGYAIGDTLAVEGAYFNSGTMTYSGTASGVGVNADLKVTAMQIAIVGSFPVSDQLSLYGKFGYSHASTDAAVRFGTFTGSTSENKNSAGYGVGAMYKVSDKISVRAGYEKYASDLTGFLVGIQLKF